MGSNTLENIMCPCKRPAEFGGPEMTKEDDAYQLTASALELAISTLQQKAQSKDFILFSLKEELKLHAGSFIFDSLLNKIGHTSEDATNTDYDRFTVAGQLHGKGPLAGMQCVGGNKCNCSNNEESAGCSCVVDPDPMQILDVIKVSGDGLMVKWQEAAHNGVLGYEVCINNVPKCRVFGRNCTTAVVDRVTFGSLMKVALYAVSGGGRCHPAAVAIYTFKG